MKRIMLVLTIAMSMAAMMLATAGLALAKGPNAGKGDGFGGARVGNTTEADSGSFDNNPLCRPKATCAPG